MITPAEVAAAADRIAGHVRRTPLVPLSPSPLLEGVEVRLKAENLQITGSFKVRGATNRVLAGRAEAGGGSFVTASGGNHGLGLTYAAARVGAPVTVYVPRSTPAVKRERLVALGAEVRVAGEVWDEAQEAALDHAARTGAAYVHPFSDPLIMAGQATVGSEILADWPEVELLVVAVGGGGLIGGVGTVARALGAARGRPVRVVGVEPEGAPTLTRAVAAGAVVDVGPIRTAAGTLAPRRTTAETLEVVREVVDQWVLVSDAELHEAVAWLDRETALGTELSGAAALAALRSGRVDLAGARRVAAVVCGRG